MKSLCTPSLVAVALGAILAAPAPQQVQLDPGSAIGIAAPTACPNKVAVEPVVLYDVTGSTLAGPYHQHLTVYGNGFATLARDPVVGGSVVETVFLPPADVAQLRTDLAALGAASLCDIPTPVSDVPLNTVTVLSGGTDARAHTFSFFLAIKQHGAVKTLLETFIATHFGVS